MCYVKQTKKNTKLENSVRDEVSVHELKRYFFKPQRKLYAAQTGGTGVHGVCDSLETLRWCKTHFVSQTFQTK